MEIDVPTSSAPSTASNGLSEAASTSALPTQATVDAPVLVIHQPEDLKALTYVRKLLQADTYATHKQDIISFLEQGNGVSADSTVSAEPWQKPQNGVAAEIV